MKLSPKQLQKWAVIRKEGKTHFAITRGIFGLGFPLLICWLIYRICFDNLLERENIYSVLGEFSVVIPFILLFGYTFGRRQWNVRERQFVEASSLDNAATDIRPSITSPSMAIDKKTSLIIAIVAGLIGMAVVRAFLHPSAGKSGSVDSVLAEASKEMNAKCPIQIDEDTRLESTVAGPGKRLTYVCTLTKVSAAEVDPAEIVRDSRPRLINSYRTLPQLSAFRKDGIELRYEYLDRTGKHIAEVSVSPADFE